MIIIRAAITKFNEVNNLMIGGPGRVIEIDEAHFGRRKNHKGRIIAGQWVLGGIDRDNKNQCFLMPVPDRSKETLKYWIKKYVRPGSQINTDCWRGYIGLDEDETY